MSKLIYRYSQGIDDQQHRSTTTEFNFQSIVSTRKYQAFISKLGTTNTRIRATKTLHICRWR